MVLKDPEMFFPSTGYALFSFSKYFRLSVKDLKVCDVMSIFQK